MRFFLGTHHPDWLAKTDVPLFVSRASLHDRRTFPRARGPWALDSAGFKELEMHGRWTFSAKEYVALVRRLRDEVGNLEWAAICDWMVEEQIISQTGLTVAEHQRRTIDSYLELRSLAPDIQWTPVLQGWTQGNYLDHAEAYEKAGVDLSALPLVGVGSICRRQATLAAQLTIAEFARSGIKPHGFGVKKAGLTSGMAHSLASADSMAWSTNARKNPNDAATAKCRETHKSCANCLPFALRWREELLEQIERARRDDPIFAYLEHADREATRGTIC